MINEHGICGNSCNLGYSQKWQNEKSLSYRIFFSFLLILTSKQRSLICPSKKRIKNLLIYTNKLFMRSPRRKSRFSINYLWLHHKTIHQIMQTCIKLWDLHQMTKPIKAVKTTWTGYSQMILLCNDGSEFLIKRSTPSIESLKVTLIK